ncbi:MAG: peptidoglycan-associated lipoprotein Pal [Burkholderiaceae bacterium]
MRHLPLALLMGATVWLAGCSSTPVAPVAESAPAVSTAPAPAPSTPAPMAATPQAAAPSSTAANTLPPYLDPSNVLYRERSIYFDFDQTIIKPAYVKVLEEHGRYLAAHPSVAIRIEGNTDELGGTEYNLALGQKRAEAVLKALETYGVKDAQMEAVSFGKERPKATGHDEAAYAQNRRADLAYPNK